MFITALNTRNNHSIIRNGLVRWYPMDEGSGSTLRDMAGSGYNATLSGGYAWENPGVDFDGSTGYATAARTGAHPTGSFTVTARIRPDGWGGGNYGRILHAGGATSGFWCYVLNSPGGIPPGTATLGLSVPGGNVVANNDVLSLGTSAHVAVVFIPMSGISFYVNGAHNVTRSGDVLNIVENTTVDIIIGDRYDGARKFDGMISDLRLYHRALSANEIAAIAAGRG